MLKDRSTYEIIRPEDIGLERSTLILGKHSGRHAFKKRLAELDLLLGEEDLERAFERFKNLAQKKGAMNEHDLRAIVTDELRDVDEYYILEKYRVKSGSGITASSEVKIKTGGKIKSHHNVTLPDGMVLELVEPLRDLYKDEVREVARKLELPPEISERIPFPGPGLAVRVLGEITPDRLAVVKEADAIVMEETEKAGLKPWQALAAILPGRATGVKGDAREYGFMIAVRAVESLDAMTANSMNLPWGVQRKIADRITSEVRGVTRVLYDLTNKPPSTIEFE
jgi:GMP synthase (glutamine-hydrolysing) B subunit